MAKKYIDADLLKAEVEKRKKANQQDASEGGAGAFYEDKAVLQLIDSLQQEQPANRGYKDCNGCEYNRPLKDQIGWQFRGCFGGDYKGKPIAEIELCPLKVAQQEQSCDTCTNDKGCVTCKNGELWEGKEQPSEDLKAEEEIEKYMDIRGLIWYDDINLSDFACHFYELGKANKEDKE